MATEPAAQGCSTDLLARVEWECCPASPGTVQGPAHLDGITATWWAATVPGTVASAARAAGVADPSVLDLDGQDWWFRSRFPGPSSPGPWLLRIGGLATIADVWLNGSLIVSSQNMFRRHDVVVPTLEAANELAIRFAALRPVLDVRRPRPRWKTPLAESNLRWVRTSLLGRVRGIAVTPPIVGPWRPIELLPAAEARIERCRVRATCDGDDGLVTVSFDLAGPAEAPDAVDVECGGTRAALPVLSTAGGHQVRGSLPVPRPERWWPHTHGEQPLYPVHAHVGGRRFELGRVGFRTVAADRSDDGFELVVNGTRVFCRGAGWFPPDPLSPTTPDEVLRQTLLLVRDAGMNMLRVPGSGVYEDQRFWELCDELGILVWQECMLAYLDPPDDPAFTDEIEAELDDNLAPLGGHPALAVVCGGQEIEEVAALSGTTRDRWVFPLLDDAIPRAVSSLLGDVPYVTSCPSGGESVFEPGAGVAHYFGVGGFLRPLEDVRRAHVRFAAECLCLATPPDPRTVDELCGGGNSASHDPEWKRAVHHDAGRSWDMDDVRDFYVRELFGVDPLMERYIDAERSLELGRAANATMVEAVFTEWRRPGSTCAGGLLTALRDLRPGAGWGLLDSSGKPKATWYAMRRVSAPVALLLTDEGLNGLGLHIVNDTAEPFSGSVRVSLYAGEHLVEEVSRPVKVGPCSGTVMEAGSLFDGFRDISYAYRFAPPAQDVVVGSLLDDAGQPVSQVVHLPLGRGRSREGDIGLAATARETAPGRWALDVTTRRFAQFVVVDVPGFVAADSWFHLPPAATRSIPLTALTATGPPRGYVSALNTSSVTTIAVEEQG